MRQESRVAPVAPRRRSARLFAVAGAVLLAALLPAHPAAAQVVVDDFATVQGPNDDPPGNPSSSVAAGGMLGGERDLAVVRSGGGGTVSAEVDGTSLLFSAPSTPDATSGQVTVTWDGTDGDAGALDPVGLSPVDLTDGGTQGGLALTVEAADAGAQIVVEVYTDAANASRVARVLPTIASQTVVFLDFAELVQIEGTGITGPADVSTVRAIVLRILGTEVDVEVSDLRTAPPQVAAAKVDLDAGGTPITGSVVPGQTVRYRITIDNAGAGAEGVDLSDVVDPSLLPLVANSVRTTPIARYDSYAGFGNVTLIVDGVTRPSVLANDNDPDGDALAVDTAASDTTSAQGGTVALAADGTFLYMPPAGFKGIDSFSYVIEATAGDPTTNATGASIGPITGTVTIDLSRTIWFVDNSYGGPFLGTQADPFDTLKDAEAASGPGDIIRLRQGDGTVLHQDQGLILKDGQMLIGGGVPLEVEGQLIEPADPGRPLMTHTSANGIDLAQNHEIHGVNIVSAAGKALFGTNVGALRITEVSVVDAGGEAIEIDGGDLDLTFDLLDSLASSGHGVRLANVTGTVTATTTDIDDPTDAGISIESSPGASFSFGATSVDGAGDTVGGSAPGIEVLNSAGATITFASIGSLTTERGTGIRALNGGMVDIQTAGASVSATGGPALDVENTALLTGATAGWTFTSLSSTGSPAEGVRLVGLLDPVTVNTGTTVTDPDTIGIRVEGSAGVAFDFGATSVMDTSIGSGANAAGIDLAAGNPGATFTFDSLAVVTDGGYGLLANSSGTINIGGSANVVNATGGPALDVTSTGVGAGWTFTTLSSAGSGSTGINLVGMTGAIAGAGGAVTGSAGTAVNVSGGAPGFTYGGTVTQNNAARVVNVENTTGGIVSLIAKVTGGASSTGVRINNADGDASFADLDLGTDASRLTSTALTLSGGSLGLFTFADTQIFTSGAGGIDANNGGSVEVTGGGNQVTTSSGVAVSMIGGTTIGAGGVTFERVDASGSTHGIRLSGAGSGFTVTGTGTTDGSGGTIQNVSQRGIEVVSTNLISLSNMALTNAATTNGPGPCPDAISSGANTGCNAPVHLQEVVTATLNNLDITGSAQHGLNGWRVTDLTFNNSTILNAGNEVGENGAKLFNLFGTSTIDGTTIDNSFRDNLRVQNDDSTELTLTIDNSFFTDSVGGLGIQFSGRGSSRMNLRFEDSEVTGNGSSGIQPQGSDDSTASGGSFDFRIHRVVFENNAAAAIDMGALGQSPLYFEIMDNGTAMRPLTNHSSHVISVNQGGSSTAPFTTATVDGIISGNFIGSGPNSSGTTAGSGIRLVENQSGTMRVRIENNTVKGWTEHGIFVIARDAAGGTGSGSSNVDVTIQGNTVNDPNGSFPIAGIKVQGGAANLPDELHDICASIGIDTMASQANVVTVGGFPEAGVRVQQRFNTTMSLYQGGSASTDPATVLGDNNTITASPATSATGTVSVVTTACDLPVTPP